MRQWMQVTEETPAFRGSSVSSSPVEVVEPPALAEQQEETEARVALGQLSSLSTTYNPGFVTSIWLGAVPFLGAGCLYGVVSGELLVSAFCGFGLVTAARLHRLQKDNESLALSQSLTTANVHWIGALLDSLNWGDTRTQRVVLLTLRRLLPQVTPTERRKLTERQRHFLLDRLTSTEAKRNPELAIAILQYVRHSRDAEALPQVEMLLHAYSPASFGRRAKRDHWLLRECEETLNAQIEAEEAEGSPKSSFGLKKREVDASVSLQETQVSEQEQLAVQKLLEELEEESRKHRHPGMRLGFLIASWCMIVPYTGVQAFIELMNRHWGLGALWVGLTAGATQLHRFALSPRQSETARRLARYGSKRVIGPLTEALDWPDETIRSIALEALTDLLPTLNAGDTLVLNAKQRGILYRSLRMSHAIRHEAFLSAILKALEQIGDDEAVGFVEKLKNASAWHPAQKRIREQAADCLPYLSLQAEKNRASMMLLRASSAVEMSPDTLLRPVSEAQSEEPKELLRPSSDAPNIEQT